jgi:hypothetical protein
MDLALGAWSKRRLALSGAHGEVHHRRPDRRVRRDCRGVRHARAATAIESIGLITVSLMSLEMAQTVVEEEVVRRVHVSAPTRVRRYLSRFLVVVVVALAIESLVGVVEALHSDPRDLPRAASVAIGAAALLTAWAVFVRFNRVAEELEPEGLRQATREDAKVQE